MSLFGALQGHVEEAAQEVGHGAEAADNLSMEGLPDFISHHIGDAKEIPSHMVGLTQQRRDSFAAAGVQRAGGS